MKRSTKPGTTIHLREWGYLTDDDISRVKTMPSDLREAGERVLGVLNAASTGDGESLAIFAQLARIVMREKGPNERRAAVYDLLASLQPRQWKTPDPFGGSLSLNKLLARFEPAYIELTESTFNEAASDRVLLRFCARLSVAVGAFGDRGVEQSRAAFVGARREATRPRRASRAK
jgi:hypothetical protein